MKQFEANKTYKTRDGRGAIVYAVLDDVIHGAIGKNIFKWGTNGKMSEYAEIAEDLIPENDWEMKQAQWYVSIDGEVFRSNMGEVTPGQRFGMKYHTKGIAQRECKRMKEANIIAYWASVLEPDYVADWDDDTEYKYYIYDSGNVYYVAENRAARNIGIPYGSRKTMQKICYALNSGEIKL